MIYVNENTSLQGNITVKEEGNENEMCVLSLYANFDKDNSFINLNVTIKNKELITNNQTVVQQQIEEFKQQLNTKLKEMGSVISI